jgi:transposase
MRRMPATRACDSGLRLGPATRACDSGLHRGKRQNWGGRACVRRALYFAAFSASRHDPRFNTFRNRLQAAGKSVQLALTTCDRKRLTFLNAVVRHGTDHVKKTRMKDS